jgi:hypothetical protein
MGFRYPHIKIPRKYSEENADSAMRSFEAIQEHELCTLRARGKEWAKNLPPPQSIIKGTFTLGYSHTPYQPYNDVLVKSQKFLVVFSQVQYVYCISDGP